MARAARMIIPGVPHHVTQRGNNRQQTFFTPDDYAYYVELMRGCARVARVSVWNWVLMPNHVHLILVPETTDGIRAFMSRLSRLYAGRIHARLKRTGHFWQGRYGCVAMDEAHLHAAMLYVSMNPVRARLCAHATGWHHSAVHALVGDTPDGVTDTEIQGDRLHRFAERLNSAEEHAAWEALRRAETVGRPLGDALFAAYVLAETGRDPRPRKRGPKPNAPLTGPALL